jgi:hypothetical protein
MRTDWRMAAIFSIVGILTTGGIARADTLATTVAVPCTGTQGAASVYPATLNVAALGGLAQKGGSVSCCTR